MVKPHSHASTFSISLLTLSEEMRGEITQDACMCEAQIVFQKKVHSAIQELSRKHILFASQKLRPGMIYSFIMRLPL